MGNESKWISMPLCFKEFVKVDFKADRLVLRTPGEKDICLKSFAGQSVYEKRNQYSMLFTEDIETVVPIVEKWRDNLMSKLENKGYDLVVRPPEKKKEQTEFNRDLDELTLYILDKRLNTSFAKKSMRNDLNYYDCPVFDFIHYSLGITDKLLLEGFGGKDESSIKNYWKQNESKVDNAIENISKSSNSCLFYVKKSDDVKMFSALESIVEFNIHKMVVNAMLDKMEKRLTDFGYDFRYPDVSVSRPLNNKGACKFEDGVNITIEGEKGVKLFFDVVNSLTRKVRNIDLTPEVTSGKSVRLQR